MPAEDAMARMRRVAAGRPSTPSAPAPVPVPQTPAVAPGAKPTRITLDLDADRYRVLRVRAAELGTKQAALLRALLDELDADPDLADRVAQRITGD